MKAEIPLQLIEGQQGMVSHIAIEVLVNKRTALFIIDTGASNTVFDTGFAAKFGLIPDHDYGYEKAIGLGSHDLQSSVARARSFEAGSLRLKQFPFVLLDLQIINQTFHEAGGPVIHGILGTDIFLSCKAVISYKKGRILLSGNAKKLSQLFKKPFNRDFQDN